MKQPAGATEGLETILEYTFTRPELLRQALTHASTASDRAGRMRSNERLEFLGDRVLGLVVAQLLFEHFLTEEEGALARRYAVLVRRDALADVAADIGLAEYMAISEGEAESGGRQNPSLLADTCEALIAALYLDGGLQAAAAFIRRHWQARMEEYPRPPKDAKTALQEWAQGRGMAPPVYREVAREGPAHAPRFTIEAALSDFPPTTGRGSSKRVAERAAARTLLRQVGGDEG